MIYRSVLVIALAAGCAAAQDEKDYPTWMKTIGANVGATKKAIDAKSQDAATSAGKIAENFEKVHGFWKTKGTTDAQELAMTAKTSAEDIVRHVRANDFEKANTAFMTMNGACKSCHATHREKAEDGSWRIKP